MKRLGKTKVTEYSLQDAKLKHALNKYRTHSDFEVIYDEKHMPLIEIYNLLDNILDSDGNPIPLLDDNNQPISYRNVDKRGIPIGPDIPLFQKIRSFEADQIIKDTPGDFGAFIDRRVDRRSMWSLELHRIAQWFDAVLAKLDTGYIRLVDNLSNQEMFTSLLSNPDYVSHTSAIKREITEWKYRASRNTTSPYIGKNRFVLAIPGIILRLANFGCLQDFVWTWKHKVYIERGPINRMQLIDIYRIEKSNYKDEPIQELLGHPGPMATLVCDMSERYRNTSESLWSVKKIMKDTDRAFNAKAIQLMKGRPGFKELEKMFMDQRCEITSQHEKCLQLVYEILEDWILFKGEGRFTDLDLNKTDGVKLLLVGLIWKLGEHPETFHCNRTRRSEIILTALQDVLDNVIYSGKNYGFNSRDDALTLKQCMSGGISNERDITVRVDEKPLGSTITRSKLLKVSKKVPQCDFLIKKAFGRFYENLKSNDDEFLITANRNEPDKRRKDIIKRDTVEGGVLVRITEKRKNSKNEIVIINDPDTSNDPIVTDYPRYALDPEYSVVPRNELTRLLINGEHVEPYSVNPTQTSIDGFELASAQYNKEKSNHRLLGEKNVLYKIKERGRKSA